MDVALALTHNCNLACSYCYAGVKKPVSMTEAVAKQALKFAFSFCAKKLQLGFFGGEPLLEWNLLRYATEFAEESAGDAVTLRKTVTTNGSLITPERAQWLRKHDFYVGFSLDGNRSMHDLTRRYAAGGSSFEVCQRGLEIALENLSRIEVIVVPDPANVVHLAESVRFLVEDKKVQQVAINPNFYAPWDGNALSQLRQAFELIGDYFLRWYRAGESPRVNFIDNKILTRLKNGFECRDRCNFGGEEIAIAPSGRIYPCERLIGADNPGEMCIGNIFDGFDESRRQALLRQRGNVNLDCLDCSIRKRCMNWCCCINYTLTGSIDTTDGIVCFHEQLAVAVADRVAAELFQERCPAFLRRFYRESDDGLNKLLSR